MPRLPITIRCVCFAVVDLKERRLPGPKSSLRFFHGVCSCGRGWDVTGEREPGNQVRR